MPDAAETPLPGGGQEHTRLFPWPLSCCCRPFCLLARSSTALHIVGVAATAERKATPPLQKEELMPGTPENGTEVCFVVRLFL